MKIALCFFGLPRLIERASQDILQYFGKECDVYAHFWWDESYKGKVNRWHVPERFDLTEDPIVKFRDIYSPVKLNYEECPNYDGRGTPTHNLSCSRADPFSLDYKNIDYLQPDAECQHCEEITPFEKIFNPVFIYAFYSRHRSILNCIRSIERIDDYDLVIVLRSDLTFIGNRPDSTFAKDISRVSIEDDTIYLPSSLWGGPMFGGEHPNRLTDWFFAGKPQAISSFFDGALNIIMSKRHKIPVSNQERFEYLSIITGINVRLFNSAMTIRRFVTEEWEDVTYYKTHHLPDGFVESIFNKDTEQFNYNEQAPLYAKHINRRD